MLHSRAHDYRLSRSSWSPTRFSTSSKRGGIVLDTFAGSGTTLIAAEKTGRRGYGIELDPRYCDVIVRRMAGAFKVEAVHAATGKPFAEIEHTRFRSRLRRHLPAAGRHHPPGPVVTQRAIASLCAS